MQIEVIDNSIQCITTTLIAVYYGWLAAKNRCIEYFLIACFGATFSLGGIYWLSYTLVMEYTPKLFCLPELSWITAFLFLVMFQNTILTPKEKKMFHPLMLISPILGVILITYFVQWGAYLVNTVMIGLTSTAGSFAIRGLLYSKKDRSVKYKNKIHIIILFMIGTEYLLWLASCKWTSYDLGNPYYWIDFCLSAVLLLFLPVMKKAVKP